MNTLHRFALALAACSVLQAAQPAYKPGEEELQQIREKCRALEARLAKLPGKPFFPDAAVYAKAAEWILRYPDEFYTKAYAANTLAVLDRGLERAAALERGEAPWNTATGRIARGYRSNIDGSIQPYGLIIPDSYTGAKPVRLDVVLHGRGATLNEVSFLAAHDSAKPVPAEQDYIQLEVFGRGNNAYRWAGETDVLEAIAVVREHYNIDPNRVVLRGFSMGGAGAWHIGLHFPDRWAAFEAGAGFTETLRYAKLRDVPPYQRATMHIYDAMDYALNASDVPFVGYGGEDDPQLQASVNIREALQQLGVWPGLRGLFLVGPHTQHKFHPASKAESGKFIDEAVAQGRRPPDRIRFVTYTPRYNRCFWIRIDELENPYERAEVDAQRINGKLTYKATNVKRLTIEGQPEPAAGPGLHKIHGLQGPIDDAFMDSFVCVRGTGKAWNGAVDEYARGLLERFSQEFAKYFRGDVRVKDDRDISEEDIAGSNLVLFGDPGSNRVIARVLGKLPIRWTREKIIMAGREYSSADYCPILIYPNPLNPNKYVVLNSGHTFHEPDLKGTNALLYPRLGDYAITRTEGSVAMAGLFNTNWIY